ncbi:MAG: uridine kinase [Bdellovibrionales bacterium]
MEDVIVLGIAGGSCSGKTTFCKRFRQIVGEERCNVLYQDNYYIDQSHRFDEDGGSVNFDHPEALDFELMSKHLKEIKMGLNVKVPLYDFATHTRKEETLDFQPQRLVLVDGILILSQKNVIEGLDDSFFIECEKEKRFQRRLTRDTRERGRTEEGVIAQFDKQVEPMHQEFVSPSKKNAHQVLSQEEYILNCDQIIQDWLSKNGF